MSKHRVITIHITENHNEAAARREFTKVFPDMKDFYKENPVREKLCSLIGVIYEDENRREYLATRNIEKPELSTSEIEETVRELMGELKPCEIEAPVDEYPRAENAVFMRPFFGRKLNALEDIAKRKGIGAKAALQMAVDEYIKRNI